VLSSTRISLSKRLAAADSSVVRIPSASRAKHGASLPAAGRGCVAFLCAGVGTGRTRKCFSGYVVFRPRRVASLGSGLSVDLGSVDPLMLTCMPWRARLKCELRQCHVSASEKSVCSTQSTLVREWLIGADRRSSIVDAVRHASGHTGMAWHGMAASTAQ
jgi:hypothetical protein